MNRSQRTHPLPLPRGERFAECRSPGSRWFPVRRILCAMLFVCACVTSPAAESASVSKPPTDPTDIPFDELVKWEIPTTTTPSKIEQPITEAPSSVTIIEADEVKKYGHRTLADILRSVPGLYVTYDRQHNFLGTRGFNRGDFNSRVLLLVDGHRVNNNLTDGAFIGTSFLLDVDLIDRVEIARGPGSVLYGNNAFFGVINVITRKGGDLKGLGGEISGEVASFDTYKARATYGHRFTNGLEVLLSGTFYDSDGADRLFFKDFATNRFGGVARHVDDDSYGSFFGTVAFRDFTLQGAFHSREKTIPTAPGGSAFNDPRAQSIDERSYVNLKYDHKFPDELDVTAQVYYDRNDSELTSPADLPPSGSLVSTEKRVGEWWGAELQLDKRVWDRHLFTFGAEYRDDFHQERRLKFEPPVGAPNNKSRSTQNYGVYFQGDFAILTNLHFNAGVRYDKYGDLDGDANPRLALIYNPVDQTVFKAIYGTAFRAPNFSELIDSRFPDVGAEEITSYELIYEQGIGQHLRLSVAGFFNQIDDLISLEDGVYKNFDVDALGVEAALEGFWRTNGLRGRLSYSFQETENRSTGRGLTDSPKHLVKVNLIAPLLKEKIFAGLEYQYTSSRATDRTLLTGGTTVPGSDAGAFGIVNFTLFSQNLIKGLELSASVYNLFDKKYGDPSTPALQQDIVPADGRTFRVKLTYKF